MGKFPVAVNCCCGVPPKKIARLAGETAIDDKLDAAPIPVSVAVCGLLLALSVTVNCPVLGFLLVLNWVGENVTVIAHRKLAGTVLPQLLPDTAKSPLAVATKLRDVFRLSNRVMVRVPVVPTP